MAWSAKLTSVNTSLEKTVDSLSFTVEFSETDGRKTTKTYILYLDELADTNLLTLKAKVDEDKARLTKLDDIRVKLEAQLGKVI
jgi:uncharacterized protein Veg